MNICYINYKHYKGGVDLHNAIFKKLLEDNYKVNIQLNNTDNVDLIHSHNIYELCNSELFTLHTNILNKDMINNLVNYDGITAYITKYQKKHIKKEYGIKLDIELKNTSDLFYYPKDNTIFQNSKHIEIGLIGRIEKFNIKYLSKLMKELNKSIKCKLNIIGANENKNTKYIKFIKFIKNRYALKDIIDYMDLFFYISKTDVLPISVLDIIARDKPILIHKIECLEDEFKELDLINFDDIKEVKKIIKHKDYNIETKKIFYKKYNPLDISYKYYKLYKSLL